MLDARGDAALICLVPGKIDVLAGAMVALGELERLCGLVVSGFQGRGHCPQK